MIDTERQETSPLTHLHLFNLPHIWTLDLKALKRASLKALPPIQQVQPQPICLVVIDPDNDHEGPAGGACITLQSSADSDVVWYDYTVRALKLLINLSMW